MKLSLFYQRISVLDYAYLDHQRGVVGDSVLVDMELIGTTDADGILYDFSRVKHQVKEIIDQECDHRLLVPSSMVMSKCGSSQLELTFQYGASELNVIYYRAPDQAFRALPSSVISRSNIAHYLENLVMPHLPANISAVRFLLYAPDGEDINQSGPSYFHYTHGLKRHYGNCQRLFHGHRNTIRVEKNGMVDPQLEQYLAQTLFAGNVHFVFWENVANQDEIIKQLGDERPVGRYHQLPKVEICYHASQGTFAAALPGKEVYFLPIESTVENLALHFLSILQNLVTPTDHLRVQAFEGLGKGAIAAI